MSASAPVAIAVPRARIRPPASPSDLVSRPRLLRRLDEAAGLSCLVAAPAGFGKTTLMAQWARQAESGRVAWLSIDETEAEPSFFWAAVAAALRAVDPNANHAANLA